MESTIRSALTDLLKKQMTTALVRMIPAFSSGILGTISGFFVGKLAEFLVNKTILGAKILNNNMSVAKQVKQIEVAIGESKKENLSEEDKKRILDKIRRASDELINF